MRRHGQVAFAVDAEVVKSPVGNAVYLRDLVYVRLGAWSADYS